MNEALQTNHVNFTCCAKEQLISSKQLVKWEVQLQQKSHLAWRDKLCTYQETKVEIEFWEGRLNRIEHFSDDAENNLRQAKKHNARGIHNV